MKRLQKKLLLSKASLIVFALLSPILISGLKAQNIASTDGSTMYFRDLDKPIRSEGQSHYITEDTPFDKVVELFDVAFMEKKSAENGYAQEIVRIKKPIIYKSVKKIVRNYEDQKSIEAQKRAIIVMIEAIRILDADTKELEVKIKSDKRDLKKIESHILVFSRGEV